MPIKVISVFLLVAIPAACAGAQEWRTLDSLTFIVVGAESVSISENAAAGSTGESAQPDDGSGAEAAGTVADDPDALLARIRSGLDSIEAEQSLNGENSPGLVPLLTELAEIYHEIGDYGDAMAALEQAQQIVRRAEGLYSLEQALVIEPMIEIQMAIAPTEQATELEMRLRDLVLRNPGDPRNIDIMMGMAGRQMGIVDYLLVNGLPPEFVLNIDAGVGPQGPRFTPTRTTRSVAASMLRRARSSYALAMNEAINHGLGDIPLLLELEDSIIDSFYFELTNPKLHRGGRPYSISGQLQFGGRNALAAKLANSRLYPGTPEAVTAAMLELADWDLMFLAFGRAMDRYDSALGYLRSRGADAEQVAAVFSPAAPIPLPASTPGLNNHNGPGEVRGHFDLEVDINRFGRVRSLRIIDQSPNATSVIERRLRRFVYQSRFRPRYVDGEWLRRDRFRIRYEFSYSTT
ncbi:MAG TPA: tetratricopeptide repeat protein [Gammaproteobacteria bacterium]|jgi:tetratricopeptide (TPR) repeat protein